MHKIDMLDIRNLKILSEMPKRERKIVLSRCSAPQKRLLRRNIRAFREERRKEKRYEDTRWVYSTDLRDDFWKKMTDENIRSLIRNLEGQKSIRELARIYNIHPNQVRLVRLMSKPKSAEFVSREKGKAPVFRYSNRDLGADQYPDITRLRPHHLI